MTCLCYIIIRSFILSDYKHTFLSDFVPKNVPSAALCIYKHTFLSDFVPKNVPSAALCIYKQTNTILE